MLSFSTSPVVASRLEALFLVVSGDRAFSLGVVKGKGLAGPLGDQVFHL